MYIIILYGIYLKCSGIGVPGHFQIVVEKSADMAYNILNKTAGKGGQGSPSWRNIKLKNSRLLFQEQGGYFLCV